MYRYDDRRCNTCVFVGIALVGWFPDYDVAHEGMYCICCCELFIYPIVCVFYILVVCYVQ